MTLSGRGRPAQEAPLALPLRSPLTVFEATGPSVRGARRAERPCPPSASCLGTSAPQPDTGRHCSPSPTDRTLRWRRGPGRRAASEARARWAAALPGEAQAESWSADPALCPQRVHRRHGGLPCSCGHTDFTPVSSGILRGRPSRSRRPRPVGGWRAVLLAAL